MILIEGLYYKLRHNSELKMTFEITNKIGMYARLIIYIYISIHDRCLGLSPYEN